MSQEAESSLIGCIILDNNIIVEVLDSFKPTDFSRVAYQKIFDVITHLYCMGSKVDLIVIKEELRLREWNHLEGEKVETVEIACDCVATVPHTGHYKSYIEIVRKAAKQRNIRRLTMQIDTCAKIDTDESRKEEKDLIAKLEATMADDGESGRMVEMSEIMNDWSLPERKDIPAWKKTGFDDLDRTLDLYEPGTLTFIAGRPGQGKTTFARQLMMKMAEHEPVELFSLEESMNIARDKMICTDAHINFLSYQYGQVTEDEIQRIIIAAGRVSSLNLRIHNKESIGLPKARIISRWHKSQFPENGAIWIDHLQLMDRSRTKNDNSALSEITRGLKRLALEVNLPILVCCALNRNAEHREGGRPSLADLRDCGAIESDADKVLFIFTPDVESPNEKRIFLGKHRNGPCGGADVIMTAWGELLQQTTMQNPMPPPGGYPAPSEWQDRNGS
jgi:replicative DNA helicase